MNGLIIKLKAAGKPLFPAAFSFSSSPRAIDPRSRHD
jgi:hypothetical protein